MKLCRGLTLAIISFSSLTLFGKDLNRNEPEMDRLIFPRIPALAEVGWLDESRKDWESFSLRLDQHLPVPDILDIYY